MNSIFSSCIGNSSCLSIEILVALQFDLALSLWTKMHKFNHFDINTKFGIDATLTTLRNRFFNGLNLHFFFFTYEAVIKAHQNAIGTFYAASS